MLHQLLMFCTFEHPLVMIEDYNYLPNYLFGASKTHPHTNYGD